jgi:glycerate 2-kinase
MMGPQVAKGPDRGGRLHVLIAPDKFKGSLTSFEVCDALEKGLWRGGDGVHGAHGASDTGANAGADAGLDDLAGKGAMTITKLPLADGGDGLLDIISYYTAAERRPAEVQDPLGRQISSYYLLSPDGRTAFVEMAKASGLDLLTPSEYDCLHASTFGTGQLISAAIRAGAKEIVIGIGGSATNDGGMGMAAALGWRFLDKDGKELPPMGASLIDVVRIVGPETGEAGLGATTTDIEVPGVEGSAGLGQTRMWASIRFRVAVDVKNPLIGVQGATRVYAPQKGADPAKVEMLEAGMQNFSGVLKKDLGLDLGGVEGAGAAGGLGAGCMAFLGAAAVRGVDLVIEFSGAAERIREADIIITGEGKIDAQTMQGKLVAGVAELGRRYGKRVFAVCGKLELSAEELRAMGIEEAVSILGREGDPGVTVEEAMQDAAKWVEEMGVSLRSSAFWNIYNNSSPSARPEGRS